MSLSVAPASSLLRGTATSRLIRVGLLAAMAGLTILVAGCGGGGHGSAANVGTTTQKQAPAGLVYAMSSAAYKVGDAIGENRPSVSGDVEYYSIEPQLPSGLTIDATSGIISGIPSAVSAKAVYTVTARNSAGVTTARVEIEVLSKLAPPAGISYQEGAPTYTVGQAITVNRPSSTGGPIASFTIAPSLPSGLTLDAVTGDITGTPTAILAETVYTVTATNAAGAATATLRLTVGPAPVAPTSLTYDLSSAQYFAGTVITPNRAHVVGGTTSSFSVSPALPSGLSLNLQTGAISGTPTAAQARTTYTITAGNAAGYRQAQVQIEIIAHDSWSATGSMPTARPLHALVRLNDGRVLSAGGFSGGNSSVDTAIYDPATGTWAAVAPMNVARAYFKAAVLQDGRVLVFGGYPVGGGAPLAAAEIYDPLSNIWQPTASMSVPRMYYATVTLPNGKVWVIGGTSGGGSFLDSIEEYNPATNTWTTLPIALPTGRAQLTAQVLADGVTVLVAGGTESAGYAANSVLIDSVNGTQTTVGAFPAYMPSSIRLTGGKVVALNEWGTSSLFDPATSGWTASPMQQFHQGAGSSMVALPDGRAFISGGYDGNATELFDPATGVWTAGTPHPGAIRNGVAAVLLADGRVLLAGGSQTDCLIYQP